MSAEFRIDGLNFADREKFPQRLLSPRCTPVSSILRLEGTPLDPSRAASPFKGLLTARTKGAFS
jgi:hypothetical protein